jgi:outer membrane protein assembly factor BamB
MIRCLNAQVKGETEKYRFRNTSMKLIHLASLALCAVVLAGCGGGGEPAPSSIPGMSVSDGAAYLASNSHIYKFNAETGAETWRYPQVGQTFEANASPGPFAGEPLKFNKHIVVGGAIPVNGVADSTVYGIADANGQVDWRWKIPASEPNRREFADGIVTDGKLLFAANGNGTLYALKPPADGTDTATVAWQYATQNKLWSRPLVDNNMVFQSSLDHTLTALDAATGKVIWTHKAGAPIASTPTIADGVLFVGAFDGKFYALDAKTGQVKWTAPVDAWIWARATVTDGAVFFGDVKGRFYALSTADGSVRYTAQIGDSVHAQPVIVGSDVYVASNDSYLYVLPIAGKPDANGVTTATRFNASGFTRRLLSTPTIVGDRILMPLFDGDVKLSAFSLKDKVKNFDLSLPTVTPRAAQ